MPAVRPPEAGGVGGDLEVVLTAQTQNVVQNARGRARGRADGHDHGLGRGHHRWSVVFGQWEA